MNLQEARAVRARLILEKARWIINGGPELLEARKTLNAARKRKVEKQRRKRNLSRWMAGHAYRQAGQPSLDTKPGTSRTRLPWIT